MLNWFHKQVVLIVCAASAAAASGQTVSVTQTTPDLHDALTAKPALVFATGPGSKNAIVVDDGARYQTMDGFGAAMTDSSAWLLEKQLTPAQREEAMRRLFNGKEGIGISFVRVPLGASDLARNHYSYDDVPPGQRDAGLAHFSIAHDREYILPAMRQALALNPAIRVMLSPWSPPGWMKTNDSMIGGSLRADAAKDFSAYLVRSVQAYQEAGVPVKYLSLQNEPLYETKDYPGMFLPAGQAKKLISDFVGPALAAAGHPQIILAYDHNWDHPEYAVEVLSDPAAERYTAGSAFHCYGGEASAQDAVHARFPHKGIWMTECSGGGWQKGNLLVETEQLVIDSTRNWAKAVVLWGLVLDEKNGPYAGGCHNCRAFITVDRRDTPHKLTYTVDYYAIGQASRFVHPGAVRIGSTTRRAGNLESVAFQNTDGSIALLVLNKAGATAEFSVAWKGRSFAASIPAGSVATYLWRPQPSPSDISLKSGSVSH